MPKQNHKAPVNAAMQHYLNDAQSRGIPESQARAALFTNPAMRKLFFVIVSLIAAGLIVVGMQ